MISILHVKSLANSKMTPLKNTGRRQITRGSFPPHGDKDDKRIRNGESVATLLDLGRTIFAFFLQGKEAESLRPTREPRKSKQVRKAQSIRTPQKPSTKSTP